MENTIDKVTIIAMLKDYNITRAYRVLDNDFWQVHIYFGEHKMKQPSLRELIINIASELKEVKTDIKQINGRLDKIEVRLDHVEEQQNEMKNDIKILKVEMTEVKTDIKQIKNCPTIKKELGL